MKTERLKDDAESFNVSVHLGDKNAPVVLFAVGSGGQPERYSTLLAALIDKGYTVIAPHFARLTSPFPTEEDLTMRARRLLLALHAFSQPNALVTGVGHSIGATLLIALAGGQLWLGPNYKVAMPVAANIQRIALLAPPTGFFQAPNALNNVTVPVLLWVGSKDNITPPAQSEWLAQSLPNSALVDLRITENAGHFSFMNLAPPKVIEPLHNKLGFIKSYTNTVANFVATKI
jgi:predicted dienelactone hydrolase